MIGICFGHQILAKALGGETGKNPSNAYIYGFEESKNKDNNKILLLESHSDCVTKLPENAISLFSSQTCLHEILQISDKVFSTQGHPEYTPYFSKYMHSKVRLNNGIMTLSDYEEFQRKCPDHSDSLRIIHIMNEFLRTGQANFELTRQI